MRKRIIPALLALLFTLFAGCGAEPIPAEVPAATPFPAPEGLRVAVASDLHLDPLNTEKGEGATAVQYSLELADALLWDVRQQGAEILLLTGDLVNGGKAVRHELLAEKLRQAEAEGLSVYVLPGNHDLGPATQSEFAAWYADFGYSEAYSRDKTSLSYCVKRDGLLLLMLDTGGYGGAAIDLTAPTEHEDAFLSDSTLHWAEARLAEAEQEGLRVLCAGHYNLLPEIARQPGSGFYIENGARLAELLRQYRVPLYLSGHMHLRAVYEDEGLTELLTEFLLSYPSGYSVLDLTEEGIRFSPRRIDVDAWAAQAGETDPVLLDFARWQQEGLRDYAVSNVAFMAEKNHLSRRESRDAAAFFYAVMDAYWDGRLAERRAEIESMPGCEPFFRAAEGYAYGWWLRDLLDTAVPEVGGFWLSWNGGNS